MTIPPLAMATLREGVAPVRLRLSGGSPREGVRSEERAEQRLAAGGAAPPTRSNCASCFAAACAAPPTRIAYCQEPSLNWLELVDDQPPGLPGRVRGDVGVC